MAKEFPTTIPTIGAFPETSYTYINPQGQEVKVLSQADLEKGQRESEVLLQYERGMYMAPSALSPEVSVVQQQLVHKPTGVSFMDRHRGWDLYHNYLSPDRRRKFIAVKGRRIIGSASITSLRKSIDKLLR